MIRGTTPTIGLKIKNPDIDLTQVNDIYMTFTQGSKYIEKTGEDLELEERKVSAWLTQEESFKFEEGSEVYVQLNWTYLASDGVTSRRAATVPICIPWTKQYLKRVI